MCGLTHLLRSLSVGDCFHHQLSSWRGRLHRLQCLDGWWSYLAYQVFSVISSLGSTFCGCAFEITQYMLPLVKVALAAVLLQLPMKVQSRNLKNRMKVVWREILLPVWNPSEWEFWRAQECLVGFAGSNLPLSVCGWRKNDSWEVRAPADIVNRAFSLKKPPSMLKLKSPREYCS